MSNPTLDDRISILLVAAQHPYNEAIQQTCKLFLETFPMRPEPSFLELSQPSEK